MDNESRLDSLVSSYHQARDYSLSLIAGLTQEQVDWRPVVDSSAIGWHLGHQASVNHFMVRNLTAAEPSLDEEFDRLFDSATPERDRGVLPSLDEIVEYRRAVEASTDRVVAMVSAGQVGAPAQLLIVVEVLLTALVNHEYQHAEWIGEVRRDLLGSDSEESGVARPSDSALSRVDGYWVLGA